MHWSRLAVRIIWAAGVVLGVAIAVFWYLVQSQRMDIGSTMTAVLLLGAIGTGVAIALLSGSIMGTKALASDPASRRATIVLVIVAGWIGTFILAWISWGFWTN